MSLIREAGKNKNGKISDKCQKGGRGSGQNLGILWNSDKRVLRKICYYFPHVLMCVLKTILIKIKEAAQIQYNQHIQNYFIRIESKLVTSNFLSLSFLSLLG